MATITIPKNLIKEVDRTAKNFGLSKEDFLVGRLIRRQPDFKSHKRDWGLGNRD